MESLAMLEIVRCTSAQASADTDLNMRVSQISTDTRTLQKGDVFLALKGERYDGHNFIEIAVQKGVVAVIVSQEVENGIPTLLVKDTLKAYQDIASYYRQKFDIPVIAITGSNGKTTTKNMLTKILSSKYKVYSADRNFNNEIGLPKSILELDKSYDVAVLEFGMNHAGEIEVLSKIARPDIAIITNIGKAHIGFLGSQENILKAKLEILEGLGDDGTLITNSDNTDLKNILLDRKILVGLADIPENLIFATDISQGRYAVRFTAHHEKQHYPCSLPTIGKHNVYNAMFALACGVKLGIPVKDAIPLLEQYTVAPMRNEVVMVKGVTIIKDYYNASPESVATAIELLSQYPVSGKRILVLAEILELGEFRDTEHHKAAELCSSLGIDKTFFLGDSYKSFEQGLIAEGEFFPPEKRAEFVIAINEYISNNIVSSNDVILIKGSREMQMEKVFENIKSEIIANKKDVMSLPSSPTRMYVDTGAIKHNYNQIANAVGSNVEIMPMIKANAYGSGSEIIANVFKGSRYLAVADIKEAALIKQSITDAKIFIIYQPYIGDAIEIVSEDYTCSVCSYEFAVLLDKEAKNQNKTVKIHVEVDTGSGRLGVPYKKVEEFFLKIKELDSLYVEGLFMHYSSADSTDKSDIEFTRNQTDLFKKAIVKSEEIVGTIPIKHASAGAAIFNKEAEHFNMVRPGYVLYGYYPNQRMREKVMLQPALKLVAAILQIAEHEAGTPISYSRQFVTQRKSRIATVCVGYSDGISRKLFNKKNVKNGHFVVNGQRAPIVGTICMDLTMIDITDIKGTVAVGDEVAVFDNINVTIDEMADICGTIGYEIIAQIEDKADRVEKF